MPDIGPYFLALVTAGLGALGGYFTRKATTKAGGRTAARLVHAELIQNAVSVAYYREKHRLRAPSMRRTAWDANSEALARLRTPQTFTAISESYQALEGIALLAKTGGEDVPEDLHRLLEPAIGRLITGLRAAAREARLAGSVIDAEVRALDPDGTAAAAITPSPGDEGSLTVLLIPDYLTDRPPRAVAVTTVVAGAGVDLDRAHHAWPDRALRGRPRRLILDAKNKDLSTATVVRREGDPDTGDPAVDEAYDALGVTYDFFYGEFGRDSYDGQGAEMRAVVHFGKNYPNGFWDGERIVFGDGDGRLFRRFTYGLDMTAHEFALAMLQRMRSLDFANQSGALAVSLADVFAVLVKQYRRAETADQADWLLGDGLFLPETGIRALRSLKDPGTAYDNEALGRDSQPAHMDGYVRTKDDNGGVHVNCGIPNHAFYLAATALGGYAWEGAGRIWFDALHDPKLTARSGFRAFAAATVRAAGPHAADVRAAWGAVGVTAGQDKR